MWLYRRVRSLNGKQCRSWSDCSDLGLHCLPRQAMSKDYFKIFNISQIWLNGIKVEFKTKENGIQIIKIHQETSYISFKIRGRCIISVKNRQLLFTWIVYWTVYTSWLVGFFCRTCFSMGDLGVQVSVRPSVWANIWGLGASLSMIMLFILLRIHWVALKPIFCLRFRGYFSTGV